MLKYEDLISELRQRPLDERLSLLEVLAESIKQEVATAPLTHSQPGAKFIKISEFDPNWRPSPAEVAQNQQWLEESHKLAEEIGRQWPQGISAVDAIRQDRREL